MWGLTLLVGPSFWWMCGGEMGDSAHIWRKEGDFASKRRMCGAWVETAPHFWRFEGPSGPDALTARDPALRMPGRWNIR
jgi:hypothetical protein